MARGGRKSSKPVAKKLTKSKTGPTKDPPRSTTFKRHVDIWNAYNTGNYNAEDSSNMHKVVKAHKRLFPREAHPNITTLQNAFREHKANNTRSCQLTTVFLQFLRSSWDSAGQVELRLTDDATKPRHAPALINMPDYDSIPTLMNRGPPLKPMPAVLPTLEEAHATMGG